MVVCWSSVQRWKHIGIADLQRAGVGAVSESRPTTASTQSAERIHREEGMTAANRKPLTVEIDAAHGEMVRDHAQAQGVTYRSLLHAMIDECCNRGRVPTVLQPWGGPEASRIGKDGTRCE